MLLYIQHSVPWYSNPVLLGSNLGTAVGLKNSSHSSSNKQTDAPIVEARDGTGQYNWVRISGYQWFITWDCAFYKWGDLLVLPGGIERAITVASHPGAALKCRAIGWFIWKMGTASGQPARWRFWVNCNDRALGIIGYIKGNHPLLSRTIQVSEL